MTPASAVRFVRSSKHPQADSLSVHHGLSSYDVFVDGEMVGQVWQVHSTHWHGKETTGHKAIHTVQWTYTDAPMGEQEPRRRDAASSLARRASRRSEPAPAHPHQYPNPAPDGEVVAWRCRACGEWVGEHGSGGTSPCPVEWREGVVTPGTVRRVPNAPKTPMHSFRCPDELWEAAKIKAEERGETVAEVLRKSLERYVKKGKR